MPMYDYQCDTCGAEFERFRAIAQSETAECECGGGAIRVWRHKGSHVIGDEIPGGVEIRHGLCNEDGSPRRYYSKSEMAREASRRGLVNVVEHKPLRGTDKSPHTSRWV